MMKKCDGHTLVAHLHGANDAAPGIHDSLSERDDVVVHLIASVRTGSNSSCLLQNLSDDREVGLEVATNSVGDITEALQDGRLELVTQSRALYIWSVSFKLQVMKRMQIIRTRRLFRR